MTTRALGKHYFDDESFPLNVCKIKRDASITHNYDLTEVEHSHDFTELAFIIKGKGSQIIEEQAYEISAGDVFVLQGSQKHYFKNVEKLEIINVMFSIKCKDSLISKELEELEGYRAMFLLESRFRAKYHFENKLHLGSHQLTKMEFILNSMINEQEKRKEGYQIILENKLKELIVLLSRSYSSLEAVEAQSLIRLSKVLDYLEKNFHNKLYISKLSEIACMSERNFQRVFRKAVGVSPSQYIMQIRLNEANDLLLRTNKSIYEIAVSTGFNDVNYFIKCFKNYYKITPLQYRAQKVNTN